MKANIVSGANPTSSAKTGFEPVEGLCKPRRCSRFSLAGFSFVSLGFLLRHHSRSDGVSLNAKLRRQERSAAQNFKNHLSHQIGQSASLPSNELRSAFLGYGVLAECLWFSFKGTHNRSLWLSCQSSQYSLSSCSNRYFLPGNT